LMALSDDILEDVQRRIGGGVVYLDCEDKQKLIDFYENTVHFRKFNERISDIDNIRYLQYMRFL
ncbi:MAG: GNAT family acetyltransferase, partial [Lachnospiraceae bacterium]|nr:GNAT family acetyltransferase [Lachnospiraceae bacterium]